MRTFLIGGVIVAIISLLLVLRKPISVMTEPLSSPAPSFSPSPSAPPQSLDIDKGGKVYRVAWIGIENPSVLSLIPNFTEKRTARSLIDNKECQEVVNGGFYAKDNQPTGLFVADFKTLRNHIPSSLLNGYIFIDQNNTASIQASPPEVSVRLALQAGPVLIRDEKVVKLVIRDDEFARRVIMGITQKGVIIFLTVYDPENTWSGPKLGDTPAVLSGLIERFQLTDAVNLDGGSASAFIRSDLSLQELTSVGSFFCVKKDY